MPSLRERVEVKSVEVSTLEIESATLQARLQSLNSSLSTARDELNSLEYDLAQAEGARDYGGAVRDFAWGGEVEILKNERFGIRGDWRLNQREIVNCVLDREEDCFVTMRTGGGKSLCYMLPALWSHVFGKGARSKCVTVVVSPLIALIADQIRQFNAVMANGAVAFESGPGTKEHNKEIKVRLAAAEGGVALLYITPERLDKDGSLKSALERLDNAGRLDRFVVDEAHCCSQWGHDFRNSYMHLGMLRNNFPRVPILAVTATASPAVRDSTCQILRIGKGMFKRHGFRMKHFHSTANRKNLKLWCQAKTHAAGGARNGIDEGAEAIVQWIDARGHRGASGIIYTLSRADAERMASSLDSRGISAAVYHADCDGEHKTRVHQAWLAGHIDVVVATIAFGLGISKPDVRFVIHQDMSKSVEGYYQESGRAGRDGLAADCLLRYEPKDALRVAKQALDPYSQAKEDNFRKMVLFAESVLCGRVCAARRDMLAALGENDPEVTQQAGDEDRALLDQEGQAHGQQGDAPVAALRDVTRHARVVAALVQTLANDTKEYTMDMVIKEWKRKDPKPQVAEFPPGRSLRKEDCEHIIMQLVAGGVLRFVLRWPNAYGVVYLQRGEEDDYLRFFQDETKVMWIPAATGTGAKKSQKSQKSQKNKKNKAAAESAAASSSSSSSSSSSRVRKKRKMAASSSSSSFSSPTVIDCVSEDEEEQKEQQMSVVVDDDSSDDNLFEDWSHLRR